ncbi:MAG: GNAT family N-acetyltransferase [Cellulosilyticaceae bacterium]
MLITRQATPDDLIRLWNGRFADYQEKYIHQIQSGIHEMWVLENQETSDLIGELHVIWNKPDAPYEANGIDQAYLFAFRIQPEYQGQHLGTLLMNRVLNRIKEKGFSYATIGVDPNEAHLVSMYNNWGFTTLIQSNSFEETSRDESGHLHTHISTYHVYQKIL